MRKKVLVIRFSSFGDIVQSMSVISVLTKQFPEVKIDWATKEQFKEILSLDLNINKVLTISNHANIKELFLFALNICRNHYDIIYDAHNNWRTMIIRFLVFILSFKTKVFVRSKERVKRFLYFKLGINLFVWPYRGMMSYLRPLKKLGIKDEYCQANWIFGDTCKLHNFLTVTQIELLKNKKIITLVPAAAWEMKCWPLEYYAQVIKLLDGYHFILLGGPKDDFTLLKEAAPTRVIDLSKKLKLSESSFIISQSALVLSADTGLIHVADILGILGILLIGPTAFGHTSGPSINILEIDLSCRPCTKDGSGTCLDKVYKRCLMEITPPEIVNKIKDLLGR